MERLKRNSTCQSCKTTLYLCPALLLLITVRIACKVTTTRICWLVNSSLNSRWWLSRLIKQWLLRQLLPSISVVQVYNSLSNSKTSLKQWIFSLSQAKIPSLPTRPNSLNSIRTLPQRRQILILSSDSPITVALIEYSKNIKLTTQKLTFFSISH